MIYPYKCERCSTEFSVNLSVEAYEKLDGKVNCPLCRGRVKRTFYSDGISIQYKDKDFTKYVESDE